jgi:hypothetical protein
MRRTISEHLNLHKLEYSFIYILPWFFFFGRHWIGALFIGLLRYELNHRIKTIVISNGKSNPLKKIV